MVWMKDYKLKKRKDKNGRLIGNQIKKKRWQFVNLMVKECRKWSERHEMTKGW